MLSGSSLSKTCEIVIRALETRIPVGPAKPPSEWDLGVLKVIMDGPPQDEWLLIQPAIAINDGDRSVQSWRPREDGQVEVLPI